MAENKPFEVEVLIAELNGAEAPAELYHILYDGSLFDEHRFVAIGGESEALVQALESRYEDGIDLAGAVALGVSVLSDTAEREIPAKNLEVSGLDRGRGRRMFFRLRVDEIEAYAGSQAD
jgi:proteasome alpha subunit